MLVPNMFNLRGATGFCLYIQAIYFRASVDVKDSEGCLINERNRFVYPLCYYDR